jgi:hypothetical protein
MTLEKDIKIIKKNEWKVSNTVEHCLMWLAGGGGGGGGGIEEVSVTGEGYLLGQIIQ